MSVDEDKSIVLPKAAVEAALAEMTNMAKAKRNQRGQLYGALRALRDNGVELHVTAKK